MCTTVVVGRNRSATGSVLVAHSEELGRNSAHRVELIPARRPGGEAYPLHSGGTLDQPAVLARHLATRIFSKAHYPGDHTSGVNEHGVTAANNMALMRGVPEPAAYDVVPGGLIWTEFLQLVLERAASARAGVELVGELCGRYGLSCDSGTMIAVADPQEAWWMELARDGQWVAQRVEPSAIVMRANCYRIGVVDFEDTERFLASPTLVSYARERGWYKEGPFHFADTYGDPDNQADIYNLGRHQVLEARYAALERAGVQDLMGLMRDTFEATALHRTGANGSPFRTGVRIIPRMNTEASTVAELRPALPRGAGSRLWVCLSTSLTGAYLPFHLASTEVERHFAYAPGAYDPRSAYWLFTELAKLADYGYDRCIEAILAAWRPFEAETLARAGELEALAAARDPVQAALLLTAFDRERAASAMETLAALLPAIKTRVFHEAF